MSNNLSNQVELLYSKNNKLAYQALKELQKLSEETEEVYCYTDKFFDMLDDANSYIRTRGLLLIAINSKWDTDYKIDENIDNYLKHITDSKPITARQCIKSLAIIARYKTELRDDIVLALRNADISIYKESMQSLVYKDIRETIKSINSLSTN